MSQKATKGMKNILEKNLIPPINFADGIINKTDISVTKTSDTVISIKTNFPDYVYWVEYGRDPGKKPPIEPIRKWCYLHNLPDGMEWYMQKKIGAKGTKGKHFLEPLNRMLEMIMKTMKEVASVELQATYYSETEEQYAVYDGAKTIKELKLNL